MERSRCSRSPKYAIRADTSADGLAILLKPPRQLGDVHPGPAATAGEAPLPPQGKEEEISIPMDGEFCMSDDRPGTMVLAQAYQAEEGSAGLLGMGLAARVAVTSSAVAGPVVLLRPPPTTRYELGHWRDSHREHRHHVVVETAAARTSAGGFHGLVESVAPITRALLGEHPTGHWAPGERSGSEPAITIPGMGDTTAGTADHDANERSGWRGIRSRERAP
jgi:hypothetical protein